MWFVIDLWTSVDDIQLCMPPRFNLAIRQEGAGGSRSHALLNSPAAPSVFHPHSLDPLTPSGVNEPVEVRLSHFANMEPNLRHLENPNVMESETRPQPDLSVAAVLAVAVEGHVLFRGAKIFTNSPPGNVPAAAGKAPLTSDICVLIVVQQLRGDLHLRSSISSMLIQAAAMVENQPRATQCSRHDDPPSG